VATEPLSDEMVDKFIGGRGFVAKLLFDELPRGIDAYDPQNLFIAATGPLSGHFLPASGKTHFGAKSPATGGYADSNMGGHFGPALKYAGYDVLVITGRADEPSLLVILRRTLLLHHGQETFLAGDAGRFQAHMEFDAVGSR
jgi:aldehyde:ferredoxin oxidoreductase